MAAGSDDRELLIRRNRSTGELAYYLCWSPNPQPLATLVRIAGRRWAIEETFQAAKSQVGLDHYQVRGWTSWHRHITLAMVTFAFLTLLAASQTQSGPSTSIDSPPSGTPVPAPLERRRLVPFTLAELRHLLACLLLRPVLDAAHLLTWSR